MLYGLLSHWHWGLAPFHYNSFEHRSKAKESDKYHADSDLSSTDKGPGIQPRVYRKAVNPALLSCIKTFFLCKENPIPVTRQKLWSSNLSISIMWTTLNAECWRQVPRDYQRRQTIGYKDTSIVTTENKQLLVSAHLTICMTGFQRWLSFTRWRSRPPPYPLG